MSAAAWHWGSFAFAVATFLWVARAARPHSVQVRLLWVLIVLGVVVGFFGGRIAIMGYLALGALGDALGAWAIRDRRFDARRWRERCVNAIVLRSPFRDAWWVVAGGADPRTNHHQVVQDQYFAYDFLPRSGDAWDRAIFAPCDGVVAWVEDGHEDALPRTRRRDWRRPAGNYVSIETRGGFVILAHLKKGSIVVSIGDRIRAGDAIGRCGNSGNTNGAHLHIHAQDRAEIAVDVARGVPIAFLDLARGASVLDYGDTLLPSGPSTSSG